MAEEATAVNDSVAQDTTSTASAPVETKAPEAPAFDPAAPIELDTEDFADGAADGDDGVEVPDEDSDDSASTDDTTDDQTTEEPTEHDDSKTDDPSKDDKREAFKQSTQDEIRDLVNARNDLRKQVSALNNRVYEARTADQLQAEVNPDTGENYTALEARVQAQEEAIALRDYNDQVAEAQLVIERDSERVLRDMPIFRQFEPGTEKYDEQGQLTGEKNPLYQPALAQGAAQLLQQNYIRDPNTEQVDAQGNRIPGSGQIIGQHMSTYELYKLINDATQLGATNGEVKGQKSAKRNAARADTVSSAGPKETKKDAFEEAFDREFA